MERSGPVTMRIPACIGRPSGAPDCDNVAAGLKIQQLTGWPTQTALCNALLGVEGGLDIAWSAERSILDDFLPRGAVKKTRVQRLLWGETKASCPKDYLLLQY